MQYTFPVDRIELDDIAAGATLSLTVRLRDYASPLWGLALAIRGPEVIDLTGTADTDGGWTITADAGVTGTWLPGRYWYCFRVTSGADAFDVGAGEINITTNLAAISAPYDGRTQNEIALDAINAVMANRATLDQEQYKINNRELRRMPVKDLLALRAFYATQVRRERARKSGQGRLGRAVPVRFGL